MQQSPAPHSGWLYTLDPRSKLAFCAIALVFVLSTTAPALAATLIVSVMLLLSSRVPARQVRLVGASLVPLIILVLISWPLFYSRGDDVWFSWWILRITRDGVLGGITNALRILALVYVLALLAATTDQAHMIRALVKLGLPYEWGLTISMSLRYIPTLYGLYQTVSEAQTARAWNPPAGNPIARARGYLPVLVTVLIGAIRLSDQTAMALTARGFAPGKPRTWYREITLGPRDWAVLAFAGLMLAALIAWQVGLGR
ncbi:MAG: energy-coupling factor transporter transmembrane protein EcfT [Chloroflexi bacterium]|nr:energy-coupling factor transporter transmembrane protein EcfT [Chloroflexota bacterium]